MQKHVFAIVAACFVALPLWAQPMGGTSLGAPLATVKLIKTEVVSDKKREIDARNATLRGRSMDETMVIAPQDQKNLLASTGKSKPDVLGGFVIVGGSTEKRDYLLKERVTTIGKENGAGIHLKGFFAPKVAALINRRKEGYFINPSGGKSMKVNGQEMTARYDLKDGDLVEVAGLKMQFYIKEE